MDLNESVKQILAKNSGLTDSQGTNRFPSVPNATNTGLNGSGYVTEKMYMLLQLYIQNKGWSPSAELLQCFSDMKDNSNLPSSAYLQIMANRLALDSQCRLILKETGKIVLPYEHFANAVMLKHMAGPHGLHLSIEATVRSVMDSYTIGRENYGMEKEFIIEVVQSCPNPACRYYKNHMSLPPLFESNMQSVMMPEYMQTMHGKGNSAIENFLGDGIKSHGNSKQSSSQVKAMYINHAPQHQMMHQQHQQHEQRQQHLNAAIIQQQNRMMVQQNLDNFNIPTQADPQKLMHQQKNLNVSPTAIRSQPLINSPPVIPPVSGKPKIGNVCASTTISPINHYSGNIPGHSPDSLNNMEKQKPIDVINNVSSLASNLDLLNAHNGVWSTSNDSREAVMPGQDKIVCVFAELMRNMTKMKTFIRPSMCKPYGKQSESLQKTLIDTIQLVQSLRNCLPAPHIPVSSWKSERNHNEENVESDANGFKNVMQYNSYY